jgi:hypothetical protein
VPPPSYRPQACTRSLCSALSHASLAQEIWAIFKALHPQDAARCEEYATRLAAEGLHVIPGTGALQRRRARAACADALRPVSGFSHMFLADKQAVWHNGTFTGSDTHPMLDVVAVVHTGRRGHVRGGDLVLAAPDATRFALRMQHGSIAVINAKRDAHASTVAFTADASSRRMVASLYCEPRLLEVAGRRSCKRRFATWPPDEAEVHAYKQTSARVPQQRCGQGGACTRTGSKGGTCAAAQARRAGRAAAGVHNKKEGDRARALSSCAR